METIKTDNTIPDSLQFNENELNKLGIDSELYTDIVNLYKEIDCEIVKENIVNTMEMINKILGNI